MKSLIAAVLGSLDVALTAYGQGHLLFLNYDSPPAPVTISSLPGTFNPANGPGGAFVGSNYTASLFFVNGTITKQTAFDSLNPTWVADTLFFGTTGLGPGHGLDGDGSGFFDGGTVFLTGQTSLNVTLQVRAWYNGGGIYSSYSQAFAAGQNVGQSGLLPQNVSAPPGPAVPIAGLQPFTVGIPEPSALALALLGGAGLLLLRRRK